MIINFKNPLNRLILSFFLISLISFSFAQPVEQFIKVIVAPEHTDWTYTKGEKVKFTITVLQGGNVLKNVAVKFEIGPERMTQF